MALCPECGERIPTDMAMRGLCPRCLIRRALVAGEEPTVDLARPRGRHRWTPPAPESLTEVLPQYDVLELVGQSGMGVVYLASQRSLNRSVALKVISRETTDDPEFEQRFQREALALARLNHRRIVSVYDYGQVDSFCYIAMQWVEGGDLRQALHFGALPPDDVLAIADQLCEGLSFAHESGIVHRDIKPENILLEKPSDDRANGETSARSKNIKIADFGLARLLWKEPGNFTLTSPGQFLGTPLYMAPEQIERPGEVDHRADIYSLGVVLYEMFTGELPLGHFDAVSQKADVDPRVDGIVLRCLHKDPDRRYRQVAELRADLAAIQSVNGHRHSKPPESTGHVRRPWLQVLPRLGLLALLVAFLPWLVVPLDRGDSENAGDATETVAADREMPAPSANASSAPPKAGSVTAVTAERTSKSGSPGSERYVETPWPEPRTRPFGIGPTPGYSSPWDRAPFTFSRQD